MTTTPKSLRARVEEVVREAGGQYSPGLRVALPASQVLEIAGALERGVPSPEDAARTKAARREIKSELHSELAAGLNLMRAAIAKRIGEADGDMRAAILANAMLDATESAVEEAGYFATNTTLQRAAVDRYIERVAIAFGALERLHAFAKAQLPEPIDPAIAPAAMAVKDLDLSTRTHNCLRMEGIKTLADLMGCRADELLRIPNLGRKGLAEIEH